MIGKGKKKGAARHVRLLFPRRDFLAAMFLSGLVGSLPATARAHNEDRPLALRDVALDQKLGAQVPLSLRFHDEAGRRVSLGDYFGKRPVILTLVYLRCQDLCPLTLDGLVRALRPLSFEAGKEFEVLAVSFDPHDTPALAAAKKSDLVKRYGRPEAASGWHFFTADRSNIEALTQAVGFRANEQRDQGRYAHATGLIVLTPRGKIARYFYGIEFSPRDLRLGLIEAAGEKIGSPVDQLLLFCYHYDPTTGKYGLLITRVIRLAGILTALLLGGFILIMLRREKKGNLAPRESA